MLQFSSGSVEDPTSTQPMSRGAHSLTNGDGISVPDPSERNINVSNNTSAHSGTTTDWITNTLKELNVLLSSVTLNATKEFT